MKCNKCGKEIRKGKYAVRDTGGGIMVGGFVLNPVCDICENKPQKLMAVSPHILHDIANKYNIDYCDLMLKAGHIKRKRRNQ